MRLFCTSLLAVLLSVVLLSVGAVCLASPPPITQPIDIALEPQGQLVKGAVINMDLSYKLRPRYIHGVGDTGSYTVIFLNYWNHNDTISQSTYPVKYDTTYSYATTFQATLPDADTNYIRIYVTCGLWKSFAYGYFLNEGGEIKFYHDLPFSENKNSPGKSSKRDSDPIRDTLTQEQLQTKYEVILNLGRPSSREKAEKILGLIPDSCLYDQYRHYYKLFISLGNLIKLADERVGFEFATPPPWDSKFNGTTDSLDQSLRKNDSSGLEGAVPNKTSHISPAGISLDHVDGLASEGILPTGVPITFYLRVNT